MDCAGGHLAAGDVDGSYRGHGGGHGREDLKEGEMIEKKEKLKREGKLQTQLESIVAAIMAVSKEEKFASKPHIVFQQPLPARIALDSDGRVVNLDLEKSMERQDEKE